MLFVRNSENGHSQGRAPGLTSLGQIRKTEREIFLNKLTRFEFTSNLREILLRLNEKKMKTNSLGILFCFVI